MLIHQKSHFEMLPLWIVCVCASSWLMNYGKVACSVALAPEFYKPGNGVFMEQWLFDSAVSTHAMNEPPFTDDCPPFAENLNDFEYKRAYSKKQNIIARAYFTSTQTGNHIFFAICDDTCILEINLPQYGINKTLITRNTYVADNWANRKLAPAQFLEKNVRYLLRLRYFGHGGVDFFRIGVKLPDNSELRPITNGYLWRSMEFYSWNGLLGRYYASITFPSSRSIVDFRSMNSALFPNSPSKHVCLNTLYQSSVNAADNFAVMYFGHMKLPKSDHFELKMSINAFGELNITKSSTAKVVGANDITGSPTVLNGGFFNASKYYPIALLHVEGPANEHIQVQYRSIGGSYSIAWSGLLRNLVDADPVIPPPEAYSAEAFNVTVNLTETPYLSQDDSWVYDNQHEVMFYKKQEGESGIVQGFAYNGTFPTTSTVHGLIPNTEYCVFLKYFGLMKGTVQHNIYSSYVIVKTDESVPKAPPSGVVVLAKSSTSVRVNWQHLVDELILTGTRTGYEVRYALKDGSPKHWTSVIVAKNVNLHLITLLEEYTIYEIKVAAMTTKGSGVFSSPSTVRTKEDKPTAAPTNITAHNTSSSSILVQWKDVPFWHQNGIITKYIVYFRIAGSSSRFDSKQVNEPARSLAINNLELWKEYDIYMTSFTNIGEGPNSTTIRVRTDEDKPTAAPSVVNATAVSPTSIYVSWNDIEEQKTYGDIMEYEVRYKRSDGQGNRKGLFMQHRNILINGLESYISYDIEVAGSTRKGYGPFSNAVKETTYQSPPSSPPTNIRGKKISSTALTISWDQIPVEHRNGIINQYIIQYRESENFATDTNIWRNSTIDATSLNANITDLNYYTWYDIQVSGVNVAGIGKYSKILVVQTDADAPGRPPMNFTGHFINHTAVKLSWLQVPQSFRFGTILGYKLRYAEKSLQNLTLSEVAIPNRLDNVSFHTTIANLKIYTPYSFWIAAFTYKSTGVYSDEVTIWTDEFIPNKPPSNLTAQNGSSTDLVLHWKEMDETHNFANGKVLGYIVKYRVIDCHDDRPAGCDEKQIFNVTSRGRNSTVTLSNLRKYTSYEVSIQVFNEKGKGMFSKSINVTTDEDKPDAPPPLPESWPSTHSSIDVYWSEIPESLRNGIILGYRIFYKPIDVELRRYERAPRAIDPLEPYGALPGEKMKEVNSTTLATRLEDLREYSWYSIRIGAFTSKGLGYTVTINGTCKQDAPVTAPILTVIDKYSLNEILLQWSKINDAGAKGEVLGYEISYWIIELNFELVQSSEKKYIYVYAPNRTATLKELRPFAKYAFQIAAFTEGGIGLISIKYYGETCRCPKMLHSAVMGLDPLVKRSFFSSGLMSQIVNNAVVSCCGNCSGAHGSSLVDWSKDASNTTSLKYSAQSLIISAQNGTQLVLPIFHASDSSIANLYGSLKYVPVVPIRKMLVLHKKISEQTLSDTANSAMLESLLEQYPLFLLSFVITVLAGIMFWIFESGSNKEEFSNSYFRGCGSGLWLAYISMTTVGYGDLTPTTKKGKIHAIIWMLIGLILTSLIAGNLASLFMIDFVFRPILIDSNEKVLVSDDAYQLARKLYGKNIMLGNTSDGLFVQHQLENGTATKVLIDIFKASSIANYIDIPTIMLNEVIDVSASYGVLLSGELTCVSKCVKKYVEEGNDVFLQQLSDSIIDFQKGEQVSKALINHMTSSQSSAFVGLANYGACILGILILFGIAFELIKMYRGRSKIKPLPNEQIELFNSLNDALEALPNKIESIFSAKHSQNIRERLALRKLQLGTIEQVLKMYPDLPHFDETLRDRYMQRKKDSENASYDDWEPEEQTDEGEIYYKTS